MYAIFIHVVFVGPPIFSSSRVRGLPGFAALALGAGTLCAALCTLVHTLCGALLR